MNIEEINQVDSLGRNHGLWRYTTASSIIEGNYLHGLRHGPWRYLEDDNTLIWAEHYFKGHLEGEQIMGPGDFMKMITNKILLKAIIPMG